MAKRPANKGKLSKSNKIQIRNSTAEFLIFTRQAGEDGIEVRIEDETVWLTQKLMAVLFGVDIRTISEHLRNLFDCRELQEDSVLRKFRTTAADKWQLSGKAGWFKTNCSSPTLTAMSKKPWRAARMIVRKMTEIYLAPSHYLF